MLDDRIFRYFPIWVVLKVVVVVRDEGELESLGEPTRRSRNSSEDFIVIS